MTSTINASTTAGLVQTADTSGVLALQTAGTTAVTIDTSQNVLIGVTSANTNGGVLQLKSGITFPATQVAATDANTLDDYEEGTFTPTFTSQTGAITTYTGAGIYTKIGNLVYVQFSCTLTTVGTAAGTLNFNGLPFTGSTTTASANQRPFVCREGASTGVIYYGYTAGGVTNGFISSSTGGAITWVNGYIYAMTLTYQST